MNKIYAIIGSIALSGVASATEMDTLDRVQIDAASRASLNEQWLTTNIGGFVQAGWQYSNGGGLPSTNGFVIERARIELTGDLTDESMSYQISGEWADDTKTFDLVNANLTLRMFDFANIRFGRFVPTFYAGFVDNPTHLTTLNYSVSALTFGQGRGDGVEVYRTFGDWDVSAFYNNGFNRLQGDGENNSYAIGGSVRYWFAGDLSVSGGYAYNEPNTVNFIRGRGVVPTPAINNLTFGVEYADGPWDVSVDYITNDEGGQLDNWSLVSTAAYQCMDDLQGFAQWEWGQYDGDLNLLTVGANYAFNDWVTWTNSVGVSFSELGSAFITDNTGWRAGADRGQWVARSVITFSF